MRVGFAIPGPIETAISGGYAYDRALIAGAPAAGAALAPIELPSGFPFPGGFAEVDPAALSRTADLLAAWDGPLLIDGLAYGAFPEWLAQRIGARAVALVHHPLAFEAGLSEAEAARLRASETAALAHARGVIATSQTTAETLSAEFGVPAERIAVAPPGFARRPRAPLVGEPPVVLAVGALIRRKRFVELVGALVRLSDLDWRFRLLGPIDVDADERARLDARLRTAPGARIEIAGPVSAAALDTAYLRADIFVSAASYEGYGMAIAEAALHGLPIVAVSGGAARETAAAGILLDPALEGASFENALAAALRPLLADRAARQAASDRVWGARDAILTQEATTARVVEALRTFFG